MKTVKELENELNISKVSIYNMLKKDEFKGHVFKGENNITLIDETAEQLLKARYLKEQGETIKSIIEDEISHSKADSKADSKDTDEVKNIDIIRILQQQLDTKDEQINNLLNIVLNSQKLQGTQLLVDNQNIVSGEPLQSPEPPKGFFKKFFKKK